MDEFAETAGEFVNAVVLHLAQAIAIALAYNIEVEDSYYAYLFSMYLYCFWMPTRSRHGCQAICLAAAVATYVPGDQKPKIFID